MNKNVARLMFKMSVIGFGLLSYASLAIGQDQAKDLVLVFPEDDSIGTVRHREPGKDEAIQFDRIARWKEGGQARGAVRLPKNSVVSLTIANSSAEALKALSELPSDSIQEIVCTNNEYDGNILTPISHFTSLRSSLLYGTPVTDQQMVSIERFPKLEVLNLSATKITGSSFQQISKLERLKILFLHELKFNEEYFASLIPLKNLTDLIFSHKVLGDVAAQHLSQIPSLQRIGGRWRLSDKGLENLAKLDKLKLINFTGDITENGLKSLARMNSLKYLWLGNSNVTDQQIRALENNKTLEGLQSRVARSTSCNRLM